MAAAIGVGGDGGVSVVLRERAEKGEEHRGSEKGQGLRGVADGVQGDEGAARQAAAGVACRGAVASFSSAFWREEEDN